MVVAPDDGVTYYHVVLWPGRNNPEGYYTASWSERDGKLTPSEIVAAREDRSYVLAPGETYHFKYTLTDKLTGSRGSSVTEVRVTGYPFTGFHQPVDNAAMNVVKAGAAIPVKFSLDGNKGLGVFREGFPKAVRINCATGDPRDPIEQTVDEGTSGITYNPTTGRYTYVWKTMATWAGECRRFKLGLDDRSRHTFDVKLQ